MGACGNQRCLVGVRRTLDGHLTDTSVTFEAVELFVGKTGLVQRFLGRAFSFPYLHLFSGLMLGEGNDLAHVRSPRSVR
jgi:hypothetical protein